ncbi:NHL repeat-containing protein [Geomonas sp. RF6]|uniref:NHL repeat-containing protein n=1 Tax=Geomonas sp. RF6 TaxID=2897342 RepID=UPI001E4823D5|nr:NHL repeat-containing protein [Geomonas sp. RF6]UFS70325.1 NHL repeat-containing protein [Geomonas sp. RF6]
MKKHLLHLTVSLTLCAASLSAYGANAPQVTVAGALGAPVAAPGRICLDDAGGIHVADVQQRGVLSFDGSGRFLNRIEVPGVVRGVAWNGGRLLVSHDRQVSMYNAAGTEVGSLSGYDFQLPSGIASDAAGNIYVTDSKRNQVVSFAPTGALRYAFGVPGSQGGAFNFPTGIAFNQSSGELAVADTLNHRVQFFDTSGRFRRGIGSPSAPPGPLSFTYPQGIAFDYTSGTRLYVVDTFHSEVKVYDLSGTPRYLSTIGSYGSALGELMQPGEAAFDGRGRRLLVADAGRVTIFGIDGDGAPSAGTGGALLDPVPATVSGRTLLLSGSVPAGGRVSVSVGVGAAGEGAVSDGRWSATATLLPGQNLVRVSAQWSGGSDSATVAVLCTAAAEGRDGSATDAGGAVSGGSTSGSSQQGTATWSYPGGGDCHHTKGGGLVCRDR